MTARDPKKFDPARADLLDAPERDAYLPDTALVDLLELAGAETVLDYGAGTGRVALAAAARLPRGRVIAVDESPEMIERLSARAELPPNLEILPISDNIVALAEASVDRIVAVNLLHEVRGENALAEMHRLLAPNGVLLVADWDRARPSEPGPPAHLRYTRAEAIEECAAAGFVPEAVESALPYHFVVRARPDIN